MSSYTAKNDNAERRREAVARLRVRGLSVRSIATALASLDPPIINSEGKPYGKSTIQADIDALREQWRGDAGRLIAEHQAEQLAQLREVQREAWREKDLDLVLKSHDRITKLLGSDAPERSISEVHLAVTPDMVAEADRELEKIAAKNKAKK